MVDVLICILALCFLIILHEAGHMIIAKWCGMRVDRFSIFFGPAILKFRRGETLYQVGCIPLGGFVQIAGLNPHDDSIAADDPRSYPNRPVYQRLATIFAGPGTNYVVAAVMLAFLFVAFGVPMSGATPVVAELMDGKPAAVAGLKVDDDILKVDGKPVKNVREMIAAIEGSQPGCKGSQACRTFEVEVAREGKPMTFALKPQQIDGRWKLGITPAERLVYVKVTPGKAMVAGLVYPYEFTRDYGVQLGRAFSRWWRGEKAPEFSGPVGIVDQMKSQLARGLPEGLRMIAIISILLGLFNLLPLPALDGGRLVFLAAEGLSRRRVNQRIENTVHLVGMLALLTFVAWVTFGDIARLFKR